jgi:hypothetical protein
MHKRQPPSSRFLTKQEGSDDLHEIGQVWKSAREDVFSVSLDPEGAGSPMRFIMVPNKSKPKTQPATGAQAAA